MSAGDHGTIGTCPNCEAATSREWLAVQVSGVYDGVLFWVCPVCDWAWPRFDDGRGRLTEIARRYAAEHNARNARK